MNLIGSLFKTKQTQELQQYDPRLQEIFWIKDKTFDPHATERHKLSGKVSAVDSNNVLDRKHHGEDITTFFAGHYSHPISMDSMGIKMNVGKITNKYFGAAAMVHEETHELQKGHQKEKAEAEEKIGASHYTLDPNAMVKYTFFLEGEAYGVENYKFLRDVIDGKVSEADITEYVYANENDHFKDFIQAYSGKKMEDRIDAIKEMKKIADAKDIKPLEDVMGEFLYASAQNEKHKLMIHGTTISMLDSALSTAQKTNNNPAKLKKLINAPKNAKLFSQEFGFEEAKDIICRDGRDFFKNMPQNRIDEMLKNIEDINPAQRSMIERAKQIVKTDGLDR